MRYYIYFPHILCVVIKIDSQISKYHKNVILCFLGSALIFHIQLKSFVHIFDIKQLINNYMGQ